MLYESEKNWIKRKEKHGVNKSDAVRCSIQNTINYETFTQGLFGVHKDKLT